MSASSSTTSTLRGAEFSVDLRIIPRLADATHAICLGSCRSSESSADDKSKTEPRRLGRLRNGGPAARPLGQYLEPQHHLSLHDEVRRLKHAHVEQAAQKGWRLGPARPHHEACILRVERNQNERPRPAPACLTPYEPSQSDGDASESTRPLSIRTTFWRASPR